MSVAGRGVASAALTRRITGPTALGVALLALCSIVALGRALSAEHPPPPHRLTDAERVQVGRAAAREELKWRASSRKNFPGDAWSRDDDFSASERAWVVGEARRRRVPIADVLRAIDEDLRAFPPEPPRRATAAPSRPRPFYD